MRIITRYALKEYLIPFFYCMAAFSLIYLVLDIFDRFTDFIEAQIPLWQILFFYAHYLFAVTGFAPFIVVVMPVALLLGELYTLVNFARHNELTALRATGMSLYRLMFPFLLVGFCAALTCLVIQETIGPQATLWVKRFEAENIKKRPAQANMFMDFLYHTGGDHRHWLVRIFDSRTPGRCKDVKITQDLKDGSLGEEMWADKAEWLDGKWWFFGLKTQKYDLRGEPVGGPSKPSPYPIEKPDFKETPQDFLQELNQTDTLSSWDMYRYVANRPNLSRTTRVRRHVDLHARLAMPWTCFVVILIGMPAVMTTSRKGALFTVLGAIAVLFIFFFLVHLGMILGKRELLTPWLAGWLPNLIFLGAGLTGLLVIRR